MLSSLIKKSTSTTCLKKARELHALILTTIFGSDYAHTPYVNNNLLSMYVRCGSIHDSHKVFDKMSQRNIVSYNAMIAAYSRSLNCWVSNFKLFNCMGCEGLRPNGLTFVSLLRSCCSVEEDWLVGDVVHAQVVKFGFLDNVRVQTLLLGVYSSCGDLVSAYKVFGFVVEKDVILWNSMMNGAFKNGKIKDGFFLFQAMVKSCVVPTEFTYTMLFNTCSKLGDSTCGRVVHARVIMVDVQADLPLQNALLDMYCSCGNIRTARTVFSRINDPDLVSWNTLIYGCAENGEEGMAMDLFARLLRISFPKPDEYTFTGVISAAGAFPANCYGKPLHAQVLRIGLAGRAFVGSAILSMYFRNGDAKSAMEVFNLIGEKDVVLWTEMITGYSRLGDGESALMFLCKMIQEGQKSDSFSLSGALSACADLATFKLGEMIHCRALRTGCDVDMSVSGCLVDMYAKNGNIQAARSIFSQVASPDLKCWNAMIGGYSNHGMVEQAMKLFQLILHHGIQPDQVTFLSLLSACSHSGMIESGRILWNLMKNNGIKPGLKHYSCMVSLLSRAGLLEEAEELITESTYNEAGIELWRTLLSSCIDRRNLTLGLNAAQKVLRWNIEDRATYVLLSNLYAAVGRWDGAAEMRRKIRGLMIEKDPGLSWIEFKNDVHVFSSGDQLNTMVDEVRSEAQRLQMNMLRPADDEVDTRAHSL